MQRLHAFERWRLTVEAPMVGRFPLAISDDVPLMVWEKLRLIWGIALVTSSARRATFDTSRS